MTTPKHPWHPVNMQAVADALKTRRDAFHDAAFKWVPTGGEAPSFMKVAQNLADEHFPLPTLALQGPPGRDPARHDYLKIRVSGDCALLAACVSGSAKGFLEVDPGQSTLAFKFVSASGDAAVKKALERDLERIRAYLDEVNSAASRYRTWQVEIAAHDLEKRIDAPRRRAAELERVGIGEFK